MKNLKIFFIAFSMVLALATNTRAGVSVGKQVPDFQSSDTRGNPVSLSAYRGKFVVLEWFNFDCPFVKKHYGSGNMQRLQKAYRDKGVVWLSICSSAPGNQGNYSKEETNALITEKGAQATAVLLDESGAVGKLFGSS